MAQPSNGNPRLTKMVRGWDRVIQFRTTDNGLGFSMRVENRQLSELDTGPIESVTSSSPAPARTSATCSGATSTRRRST